MKLSRAGALIAVILLAAGCGGGRDSIPATGSNELEQGYVGSNRCGLCHGPYHPAKIHATYYDDWIASSHGKTADMEPSEETIVGDHDGNDISDFKDGLDLGAFPQWTSYTADGGAPGDIAPVLGFDAGADAYTASLGPRVFTVEKIVGIGRHKQAYVTRMGGSFYVLPFVYMMESQSWNPFYPENWYTWTDTNLNGTIEPGETITGLLYPTVWDSPVTAGRTTDSWDRSCAGCHVTGISSVRRLATSEFAVTHGEDGVGCESCHGPGRLHAETLGGSGYADRAIVNPAALSAERQRDICMSCHSRGTGVGLVGGHSLDYPWRTDGTPFVPGQDLAEALSIAFPDPNDPVHMLQGGDTHMGTPGSSYGSWSADCQDCHSAHDTTNLSLVRLKVPTPSSGDRDVIFTARGGAPGSGGLMGDASDGTYTDICEVCHTRTSYFRNDSSTPVTDHNNGAVCTVCHDHARGFSPSGGTGSGGENCNICHDYLFSRMRNPTAHYRHLLDDDGITYPTNLGEWRCLSCHVDHDIFNPGVSGTSGRGANLRTDILEVPTPTTGLAATDFIDSGNGGICLSCHRFGMNKSYVRPDGSSATPPIPFPAAVGVQVAAYAAGMYGGSYTVTSTFSGSGAAVFEGDCSKCHNDNLSPKSGVGGQGGAVKFGLHMSTKSRSLSPLGYGGSAEPLEEEFCYRCHSRTSDPVGGITKPAAGFDWYDVAAMSVRAEGIWAVMQKPHGHGVGGYSGLHAPIEGAAWNWNPAVNRHVECADCHNLHATGPSRAFDTSGLFAQPVAPTNLAASTPLDGVWGVNVDSWPAAWTKPDPATAYTRVASSTYSWQVCLKCHSGYGYGAVPPAGETDQALEFNPNNAGYHAVIGPSKTTYPPNSSFVGAWTKTSSMSCSDCHTSDTKAGPQGPHGSTHEGILAGAFNSTTGQTGTEGHLCFKCHDFDVYGRTGAGTGTATGFSNGSKNLHSTHMSKNHGILGRKATCFDCHAAVPHGWNRRSMLILIGDPAPYNNGSAALSPLDVAGWPASGNWKESSCDNSPCH